MVYYKVLKIYRVLVLVSPMLAVNIFTGIVFCTVPCNGIPVIRVPVRTRIGVVPVLCLLMVLVLIPVPGQSL